MWINHISSALNEKKKKENNEMRKIFTTYAWREKGKDKLK